jgi:hypothetical protein
MKALNPKSYDYGIVLAAVALNAAAGTRTVTLSLNKSWTRVRFTINFTRSAATTVTCTPTMRTSTGVPGTTIAKSAPQSYSVSAGIATASDLVISKTTSVTGNFIFDVDVDGAVDADFVFGGASAGGSDLVTVHALATVGV